ncbi:hypothetical protein QOZ80_3AG0248790 [Eleusine coracana subsp. coracana]|nr:hypothetical protein QOZ80_3AG0248790 [Eleusine coracana subsp. coracana]
MISSERSSSASPPDEPELLVRAALVSKRWYRLISDPGFRRRFCEFHRTPPMLGCFYTRGSATEFAATSSVRFPHAVRGNWCATDARHGRVVLHLTDPWDVELEVHLVVWDPVTDEQRVLPEPPKPPNHAFPIRCYWTAAVLCATAGGGCNNDIDCHHGSFLVVFLCTGSRETFTSVCSSDSGAWSEPTSVQLRHASVEPGGPSVLVGNALYYVCDSFPRRRIIKHDLQKQETSLINLPHTRYKDIVLTAMADGGLAFAAMHDSKLFIWSREAGPKAYAGWKQSRVLELDTLLQPIGVQMVCSWPI